MYSRQKGGHNGGVQTVIYIPNTKLIASGSSDDMIKIWNYETGECLNTLLGHSYTIKSLKYIENTRLIVSGSED